MPSLLEKAYNPDVLTCLANLSNDEVFTPPELANDVLDMLPPEIWSDPTIKILDPCCKSGVFLREAAKRFIKGLEHVYPNLQERVEHIMHEQLYGIAITELTSLLARRSLYCSKFPNGRFSVAEFDSSEGNVHHRTIQHTWVNNRCKYCGASNAEYDRDAALETHAYEFIHTDDPERILNMKFDVIVGNPPYQLQVNEAGKGLGAVPIYQKFVSQAIKLSPRYLSMIIPARWFSGGVGLNDFRKEMLSCGKISRITDFTDSKDCFPGVDINGGICYFLWERQYSGSCRFTNITLGNASTQERRLDEFDIFIRRNEALSIIHKVLNLNGKTLADKGGCSPQTPYGLLSSFIGSKEKKSSSDLSVLGSKGWTYTSRNSITKSADTIDLFKPMISKLSCEHAGNPDKNGMYRVLSRMELLIPGQICTQSYLTVCPSSNKENAQNVISYLKTKFVRFLILQTLAGMNISISNFRFVPWLDFSINWTDEMLYDRYRLSDAERKYIDSIIREME